MCECKRDGCHAQTDPVIIRCVNYAPLTFYDRTNGEVKKFCEDCALENIEQFSFYPPDHE